MKKILNQLCFYALVGTLLLNSIQVWAQADAKKSFVSEVSAGGISSFTLANGFKIILIPFPSASNVRVELLVKTGSKLEGYGETGMAHLLEHMLFKGAGNRKNIKDDLTPWGLRGMAPPQRTEPITSRHFPRALKNLTKLFDLRQIALSVQSSPKPTWIAR